MLADRFTTFRIAVFTQLIDTATGRIGRTALMKMCYFLQTLKNVPLGYDFTLYSYGPFDSEVLGDLRIAEDLSAIESSVKSFTGGYHYLLSTSDNADEVKKESRELLNKYAEPIRWVANTFGNQTASELELLSTAVYVDRNGEARTFEELQEKVKLIKPHFSHEEIAKKIQWLQDNGLLTKPYHAVKKVHMI